MASKYHNRRVKADGYTFDSQAEYRRYQELRLLEQAGDIDSLRVHHRWTVFVAFKDRDGKRHRAVVYEDDFSYREGSRWIVEDVKGVRTAVFRIKEKLFRHRFPGVDFRIVEA